MGKRGPPPTPTAVLAARGSWRAKTRPDEPQPERSAPECPPQLSPDARAHWEEVIPILDSMGVLTTADSDVIAHYCESWAWYWRCIRTIQEEGETYQSKSLAGALTIKTRPEVDQANQLAGIVARLRADLGLNPSARTRIKAEKATVEPSQNSGFSSRIVG